MKNHSENAASSCPEAANARIRRRCACTTARIHFRLSSTLLLVCAISLLGACDAARTTSLQTPPAVVLAAMSDRMSTGKLRVAAPPANEPNTCNTAVYTGRAGSDEIRHGKVKVLPRTSAGSPSSAKSEQTMVKYFRWDFRERRAVRGAICNAENSPEVLSALRERFRYKPGNGGGSNGDPAVTTDPASPDAEADSEVLISLPQPLPDHEQADSEIAGDWSPEGGGDLEESPMSPEGDMTVTEVPEYVSPRPEGATALAMPTFNPYSALLPRGEMEWGECDSVETTAYWCEIPSLGTLYCSLFRVEFEDPVLAKYFNCGSECMLVEVSDADGIYHLSGSCVIEEWPDFDDCPDGQSLDDQENCVCDNGSYEWDCGASQQDCTFWGTCELPPCEEECELPPALAAVSCDPSTFDEWETVLCVLTATEAGAGVPIDSVVWYYERDSIDTAVRISVHAADSLLSSSTAYAPPGSGLIYPWVFANGVVISDDASASVTAGASSATCWPVDFPDIVCYRAFTPREDSAVVTAVGSLQRASGLFSSDTARQVCGSAMARFTQMRSDGKIFIGRFNTDHSAHFDSLSGTVHIDPRHVSDLFLTEPIIAQLKLRQRVGSLFAHEMFHVMNFQHSPPDTLNPYTSFPFNLANDPVIPGSPGPDPNSCYDWGTQ
jgi:hypothetical protein